MRYIDVHTQAELDASLEKKQTDEVIVCRGNGSFCISGSASVRAWDSASVRAWGSASVEAWDSASVRASGSASVRASGSASVEASGSASVEASRYVSVHKMSPGALVRGGVVIDVPRMETPAVWLDYYGVEAKRGIVILYKAVDADWHTGGGCLLPDNSLCSYAPGAKPIASDFDPSPRDCGRGLHGCARPSMAAAYFHGQPAHYVAVPVRVSDLGSPDPDGDTRKIRFRCAAKPCYEVDIDGTKVPS
jgi:hypothetical protein